LSGRTVSRGQEPPRRERVVSLVLLAVLIVVAAAVIRGRPVAVVVATAAPSYQLPEGATAEGWERYPAERIYEKINGRVSLFERHGVEQLDFATVTMGAESYDVYVYTMKNSDAALGVFLDETPGGAMSINVGLMADASEGLVRAMGGRHYVSVMPVRREAEIALAVGLLQKIVSGLPASGGVGGTIERLPQADRVEGSLRFNREGMLGLESLAGSFSAGYRLGGKEVEAFVKRLGDDDGSAFLAALGEELAEFGGEVLQRDENRFQADFFGRRLLVARRGDAAFGLTGELSEQEAAEFLRKLFGSFEDGDGGA